jgi:hypothetical protein
VEELSDEDVHLKNISHVLSLNVAQNVNEPFKVTV